jgi:hypothetical protein
MKKEPERPIIYPPSSQPHPQTINVNVQPLRAPCSDMGQSVRQFKPQALVHGTLADNGEQWRPCYEKCYAIGVSSPFYEGTGEGGIRTLGLTTPAIRCRLTYEKVIIGV